MPDPDPIMSLPMTATPTWTPVADDLATEPTDDSLGDWLQSLQSLGTATVLDNIEDQLYSQARQALIDQNIQPTEKAVEDWVRSMLPKHP